MTTQLAAVMADKKTAARVRREILAKQGRYLTNRDYSKFSLWLETSGLDEEETAILAEHANSIAPGANDWIGWLSALLPEQDMREKLKEFGEYLGDLKVTDPSPIETLSHLPASARGPVAWGIVKTSPSRKRALAAINFHPPGPDRDALVQTAMAKPSR